MKKTILLIMGICLSMLVHAEVFPSFGVDSVGSDFFREWYINGDLGHYLDNYSDYVVYEAETTGEWNLGDQNVFSIAGNSFRQNKYWLNGMRIDSRYQVGSTMLYTNMLRTNFVLDYHEGVIRFSDDTLQQQALTLKGNVGNLGGISPGTRELINLFHSSGEERTMDKRPVEMRNHVIGAGGVEASFAIPAYGKQYYQHAYAHYGWRTQTAFDHTGISGMYASPYYTAQLDGELPMKENNMLDKLNYYFVTQGRGDLYSEFLYNRNEVADLQAYTAALYGTKKFSNGGELVAGLSWALSDVKHDSLEFARNLLDQDGEAFDPWYADGKTNEASLSVQYDQRLLPWLRVHAEGYNSFVHFNPTTDVWSNDVYMQSIADKTRTPLYTYHWQSNAYGAGLLENEALLVAEYELARGLRMQAHLGVSLDGVLLNGKSMVSPNWLAKFALDWKPNWWFQMGLNLSHNRMSYTMNEVQYLSNDYLNGEIRYADGTLLATTGGKYHAVGKGLWAHQPSYAVLDIPIRFTFDKQSKHQFALWSSIRKYYNMWFTDYTNGLEANMYEKDGLYYWREGEKNYTVGVQPMDLMSGTVGGRTPYYMSNVAKYSYTGKKWLVSVSWQSYLMAGLSTLGNGPLHNNIGVLAESSANPNVYKIAREEELPYQGNSRLNQDKSFILRLQVTYNACKYFSVSLNGKFKDGQPFANMIAESYDMNGHKQLAIWNDDAKGINMANNFFGKREDAFFNFDLRMTGRWWIKQIPFQLDVTCYNIYDFGTALTEYVFDKYDHPTYPYWTNDRGKQSMHESRTSMSLCIPRGLLMTLRIGLEADKNHPHTP